MHFDDWLTDISNLRVWVFLESIFFFTWISASSIFISIAYLFKLEPTNKTEEQMRQDDDVWNDRNAEDFLRYMKYDYYIVTLNMSMLILEYIVGFSNFNGVEKMGNRDVTSVQTIYALLIVLSLL